MLLVAAGTALTGCAGIPPGSGGDTGTTRTIALVHPGSGESVSVAYRHPGGYDPVAMSRISWLFRDHRTGEATAVDPALIDLLADLRERLDLPSETPILLTSGYRTAATNASLAKASPNVAENSYHIHGRAADIHIAGVAPQRLHAAAASLRRGGYAVYPSSGHVHVDTGPYRTWTPKGGDPNPRDRTLEARAVAPQARRAPLPEVRVAKPGGDPIRELLATLAADRSEQPDGRAKP